MKPTCFSFLYVESDFGTSRCVTTQVSVNSQIHVIENVSFSLLLVTFSIKANFAKEYLWKSVYLRFPGSLKPSSSICYVLFSSEEKYFWALLFFHKIPLKLKVALRRNFTFLFPLFLPRITYRHVRCLFVQKEKIKRVSFIKISPFEK